MPQTIALSKSAVAKLRFRIKGYLFPVRETDLEAFGELVAAGIMEPVPGAPPDFRFTEDGFERRMEILEAAEEHLRSLEPRLPDRIDLSEAARALLRTCVVGPNPDGDETNRPAYRELVKAGIMMPVGTFSKGDECVFRFTFRGWERRFEFAGMDRAKETA